MTGLIPRNYGAGKSSILGFVRMPYREVNSLVAVSRILYSLPRTVTRFPATFVSRGALPREVLGLTRNEWAAWLEYLLALPRKTGRPSRRW